MSTAQPIDVQAECLVEALIGMHVREREHIDNFLQLLLGIFFELLLKRELIDNSDHASSAADNGSTEFGSSNFFESLANCKFCRQQAVW